MTLNWHWTAIMRSVALRTCLSEPTTKIWMKIDPYYQRQKCSPWIAVYSEIRFMGIFGGLRWRGGFKWEWGPRKWRFLLILPAISSEPSHQGPQFLYYAMHYAYSYCFGPKLHVTLLVMFWCLRSNEYLESGSLPKVIGCQTEQQSVICWFYAYTTKHRHIVFISEYLMFSFSDICHSLHCSLSYGILLGVILCPFVVYWNLVMSVLLMCSLIQSVHLSDGLLYWSVTTWLPLMLSVCDSVVLVCWCCLCHMPQPLWSSLMYSTAQNCMLYRLSDLIIS